MVVDDDVFVVSALAELLEDEGYDVHTSTNGFSALRQAIELRPAVMLLDLALPERSGADLLRDLRTDPAVHDLAIVIVSGHTDDLSEQQLAQADGVVKKPFDVAELLNTVHRAVQRAGMRRAEVAPVTAVSHSAAVRRVRRSSGARRTGGRR
jgi:two-component system chemotaxis response regulator CheY